MSGDGSSLWLRMRVIAAVVFSQVCVGGYNVILGMATKDVDPLIFSWYRDMGCVVCFMTLLAVTTGKAPWRSFPHMRDLGYFIVYGSFHVYFGQYFMVLAAKNGYPLLTSMWLNTGPVIVALFSLLSGIEVLDFKQRDGAKSCLWNILRTSGLWKVVGMTCTVAGSVLYVYLSLHWDNKGGKKDGKTYHLEYAHLFMAGEVVGAAVFHTIEKKILRSGYSAVETAAWGYTFGGVLLTFVAIPQLSVDKLTFAPSNWIYIGYSAVVNSFISALTFTWANKKSGPIFVNSWRPLQTIVTALLQWFFHSQTPQKSVGVAAGFIVPGIYSLIVSRHFETKGKPHGGEDDKMTGGTLRMKLRAAQRAHDEARKEIRSLRERISLTEDKEVVPVSDDEYVTGTSTEGESGDERDRLVPATPPHLQRKSA